MMRSVDLLDQPAALAAVGPAEPDRTARSRIDLDLGAEPRCQLHGIGQGIPDIRRGTRDRELAL
jgi:hypothetical protein